LENFENLLDYHEIVLGTTINYEKYIMKKDIGSKLEKYYNTGLG
jgi:hypothetical protein